MILIQQIASVECNQPLLWTEMFPLMIDSVQFSRSVLSDSFRPHESQQPGLPVHHQLLEFTQTHVHRVSDAVQPSHPLLSPSPPAPNPSQHQSLFQWVNSAWGGQSIGVSALASALPSFDFPGASDGKASVYNEGDRSSIPGLGRFPGEGNGNPLQYYCLENSMDREAW